MAVDESPTPRDEKEITRKKKRKEKKENEKKKDEG